MNAKQVADELENIYWIQGDGKGKPFQQYADFVRQQQAEIERLIGAKPITYGMLTFCKNCGEQNPYQAKTLTDEEIRVVWYGHPEFKDGLGVNPIPFARAILRKAQEK